jgi:NADH:flavin oxidoreductase / NADH oxidase family
MKRGEAVAANQNYNILLEPVTFGPKTMRNRFWQSSHCTGYGSDRPGTQARFRGMKAEGGWAVVCTEFCSIHPESDEYPWHSARLWDEGDVINLRHPDAAAGLTHGGCLVRPLSGFRPCQLRYGNQPGRGRRQRCNRRPHP